MRPGKIKIRLRGKLARYSRRSLTLVAVGVVVLLAGGGAVLAQLGGAPKLSSSSDIALSKGLIGWWKLDGNAKDSTAYGRNGTSASTADVADRKGMANGALSFDGSSSYIVVNNFDSTVMNPANFSSSWTLSVWAKEGASQGAEKVLIGKLGCNGGIVTDGSNGYRFQLFDSACSTRASIDATPANPTTSWHLLTATYSNGAMGYYLDGQLVSTASLSTMYNYPATTLGIGAANSTPSWVFNGSLDDARVYNRAISAAEVMAIYKSYNDPLDAAQGENGLVGWWKFDGNTKDASPYGNNGTASGASLANDRKGMPNSAYSFNGTSSFVNVANNSNLDSNVGTWSVWLKVGAPPGGNPADIMDKHDATSSNNGLSLTLVANGSVLMQIKGSSTSTQCSNTTVVNDSKWHLITATFNNTSAATLYVDGTNPCSFTPTASWSFSSQPLRFGKSVDSFWSLLNGSLDDARIYNRVLSATEVINLYNSYNSVVALGGASGSVQLGKGLVGDWPMNGNIKDSTPYGDTGTVNGATLTTDRKGRANSAYSFNGTSNYIQISKPSGFSPTSDFTISAWINGNNFTTSDLVIVQQQDGTGTGRSLLYVDHTLGKVGSFLGGANTYGPTVLSTGTWYLATVVHSGSHVTVYTNGQPGTFNAVTAEASNGDFLIGVQKSLTVDFWDGKLDDLRVWNRALNQAEITALYNEYR